MDFHSTYLVLAIVFGFFMAWGIGANDVANAMGTSVGSKALTITQAVIVAAIFESLGTILAGGSVTQTIQGGIINSQLYAGNPEILIYGMLAALLSAGTWLLVASYFGWPVSTTHTIVGAIIGFGLISVGGAAIDFHVVISIGLSWLVTPVIAGIFSFVIFTSIRRFILTSKNPWLSAQRLLPCYIFLVVLIISLVTLLKGLQHTSFHFSGAEDVVLALGLSLIVAGVCALLLRRKKLEVANNHAQAKVERLFGMLMVFTGCSMAFAHGSNDAANAIGPVAAIVNIAKTGAVTVSAHMPMWILYLGAIGIVAGLAMYGYKVIATVGTHITEMTPSRGFAVECATVCTVILASGTGLPISTTQTLVGAILGVGFARGMAALNMNVIRKIFISWIITLPIGAGLAILFYYILRTIFGVI